MKLITQILFWCCICLLPLNGADWQQWGGSNNRNMYSPEKDPPTELNPGKFKESSEEIDIATTKNVRWVVKLGSQSYGNVVVSQGRVFIGTNNDSPRDKRHIGDKSVLLCLSEKTGEFLWQLVIPKHKAGKAIDWDNLGLLCTPTVEGNRVYIVSTRCEVLCLDIDGMQNGNDGAFKDEAGYFVQDTTTPPVEPAKTDGDIIWLFNMLDELGVLPHNAANGSILIIGDILYTTTSNGAEFNHNYVPFPYAPSVIAIDKKTGKFLAEDNTENGHRIFHGQWSSTSSGNVNGRNLIFFGGGDGWLYALDAEPTVENARNILKVVWKADCNPQNYKFKDGKPIKYPDPEGMCEVISTTVFYNNKVYVAIGQDPEYGEGVGRLLCFDATKTGDITTNGLVWNFMEIKRSLSTVSIDPDSGLLFIADYSGFVYCLDAGTGKHYWIYDMKSHIWGSTLVVDGKVYVGDEDGDLVILPARKDFNPAKEKPIFEVNMNAPIYSTPVFANGTLYISTPTHLYAIAKSAK